MPLYPLLVMPKSSVKNPVVAICALGTCFVVGFGGAHAGDVIETQSAIAQAREAASAVNTQADALEHSLIRAQGAIRASAFAHDEEAVTTAAAHVELATNAAQLTTSTHQTVLATTERVAESPPAVPTDGNTVAQVLAGDIDSPAAARDVTEALDHARVELDRARTSVDDQVRELNDARAEIKHEESLQELDGVLDHTPAHLAAVGALLEQVGADVTKPTFVADATDAVSALDSAAATARHVDRTDPDLVDERLANVTSAKALLDRRLADLADSHQAWVTDQNIHITAHNTAVLTAHDAAVETAREQHILDNRAQVSALSNGWSGQPEGVSGGNGRLSRESLCELDFAPQHRLQCDAAASLSAANAQYFADTGRNLVLTDSYRSYSLQVRTRALKPRTAARPGSSNHGWGMAIDMDRESARWLTDNGADYGWVNPDWASPRGSRPEWWHLEYVATSVGAFEAPAPSGLTELVVSVFESETDPSPKDHAKAQPTSANVAAQ